jgi:hypothetical protein
VLKKFVITLFTVVILLQSGFVAMHAVFKIKEHKRLVKKEIKKQLKDGRHNKDLVAFTSQQLRSAKWEHSKEFFLGSGKYDVVRTEEKNGVKIYWCINDSKEQDLYKKLNKNQSEQNTFADVFKKLTQISYVGAVTPVVSRLETDIPYPNWMNHYQYHLSLSLFRPPSLLFNI